MLYSSNYDEVEQIYYVNLRMLYHSIKIVIFIHRIPYTEKRIVHNMLL